MRNVPGAAVRQSSITSRVDSPLWRQNKFQLRPCEIEFPRSIRGLRIVERFSRFCSGLPFFFFFLVATSASRQDDGTSQQRDLQLVAAKLWHGLCCQSHKINKSLRTDVGFFFPFLGKSHSEINSGECEQQHNSGSFPSTWDHYRACYDWLMSVLLCL